MLQPIGKDAGLTPTQSLFLLTLHSAGSRSGAEIVQTIREDLGQAWVPSPGAVYKTLKQLVDKGLIAETTTEESRGDNRVRTYKILPDGDRKVREVVARANRMYAYVSECCGDSCDPGSRCRPRTPSG